MDTQKTEKSPEQMIQAYGELMGRMRLASTMAWQSYGGKRNVMEALGYPTEITYADMRARYARQDIATAVIDRPVDGTWAGELRLEESDDDKVTKFEAAWDTLEDELHIRSHFNRLDRLACLGEYAVLLLGLSDVVGVEGFASPTKGNSKLMYLKSFGQGDAEVLEWETDPANSRYGMPRVYQVKLRSISGHGEQTINVHYTRIIHVVVNPLESDVAGEPVLYPIWNRLMDLEKIVGGDGEIFWRNARPGYHGKLDDGYTMSAAELENLQTQVDEYEHDLRRTLIGGGLSLNALNQPTTDPTPHVDIQIQMISAQTGIPKRILTGSERGELASSQDQDEWAAYLSSRREKYAETRIIRPVVTRLQQLGILPLTPTGYTVKWADLFAKSEKEKTEIGKIRAETLNAYLSSPMVEAIIPPAAFLEFFLGLDQSQMTLIEEMQHAMQTEDTEQDWEEETEEEEVI